MGVFVTGGCDWCFFEQSRNDHPSDAFDVHDS
jgi:hypothetical protein